jgi:hypothetical protein
VKYNAQVFFECLMFLISCVKDAAFLLAEAVAE